MSFHTRLAAEAHRADGEFLPLAINRDKCQNKITRKSSNISITKERQENFKPE